MSRQRLECAELAPALVPPATPRAPASRWGSWTHSTRFASHGVGQRPPPRTGWARFGVRWQATCLAVARGLAKRRRERDTALARAAAGVSGRPGGRNPASTQSRQVKTRPPRSNPNGVAPQSPGLARRQPWVIARRGCSTPTGLRPGGRKTSRLRCLPATTPFGLTAPPSPPPRLVPSVQRWALFHNRVAVEGAQLCSRPLSLTRKRPVGMSAVPRPATHLLFTAWILTVA